MEHRSCQDFFRGLALDFWRKASILQDTAAEVRFLDEIFRPKSQMKLLDVPCGFGRHAVPMAERGYKIRGVDLCPEFIEEAKARSAAKGVAVEWICADMAELSFRSRYDGAYCLGNSFGYLDADGMKGFLAGLSGSLRPGSQFVLDSGVTAESILPNLEGELSFAVDDIDVLAQSRYVVEESRLETTYTFTRNGVAETRTGSHWVFTIAEIRRMLTQAGFTMTALYGSFERVPFTAGAPHLVMVTEKREL